MNHQCMLVFKRLTVYMYEVKKSYVIFLIYFHVTFTNAEEFLSHMATG